ncbi:MAG: HlyC/CorC family transporter [Planctomycetes bacterium]|nr:HlyC/CorC family transporter [Planctomycetota bacterium]
MDSALLSAAVLCLIASIFFSIAEGALLFFSRARLEQQLKSEKKMERASRRLANKDKLLLAAFSLNNLFNILFVVFVTVLLMQQDTQGGGSPAVRMLKALAWSIAGVLVVGDMTPRAWAQRCPEAAMILTLRIMSFIAAVLRYPLMFLEAINELVGRVFGAPPLSSENGELEEQILSAVSESEMEGEILEDEKEMFESIFDFMETDVAQIMTPRTDMVCIEISGGFPAALELALEKGFSRLPVFEKNRDNIVGLLYVKDLLKLWGKDEEGEISLREVLRKPLYVPETKQVLELLHEMQEQRMHMAIILDEYGGTSGLVTVEDIVEEIVGEIQDEYDRVVEMPLRPIDSHTIEVDAKIHIEDVNEALDIQLPEDDDYDTIGGFLFSQMGKIPAPGETFARNGIEFTILDADERRIKSLRITVHQSAESEED